MYCNQKRKPIKAKWEKRKKEKRVENKPENLLTWLDLVKSNKTITSNSTQDRKQCVIFFGWSSNSYTAHKFKTLNQTTQQTSIKKTIKSPKSVRSCCYDWNERKKTYWVHSKGSLHIHSFKWRIWKDENKESL